MLVPTASVRPSSFTTGSYFFAAVAGSFVNPRTISSYRTSTSSSSPPASSSSTALKMVDPTVVCLVPGWVRFCSNLAPLASMAVLTAPMPTIQQIVKDKSVGSLPLLPYSSMIANCFLWTVYGLLLQQSKIWATNGIGLALGAYYFFRFIKFAPKKAPTLPGSIRQHSQAIVGIIIGTLSWALTCYATLQKKGDWAPYAAKAIGNAAVLLCLVMFASPLSALKTVLQTKSAQSIPLPFTLATVANCFLWAVAGFKDFHDFNVYFPNSVGLGLGLTQAALKVMYGNGSPMTSMTKSESEAELSM